MSIVVDGHGTSIDYLVRAMSYEMMADFLEGKGEARKNGELLTMARSDIACGLWSLGVRYSRELWCNRH